MVKAPCFQCREHEFTWGRKIPMPHGMAKTAPPKSSILLTVKKNEVVQFSRSVLSDSLWLHELQHARLPHPSPTPGDCSNSCPLNQWCHPTISSSVIPFSSHLQSFPASLVFSNGINTGNFSYLFTETFSFLLGNTRRLRFLGCAAFRYSHVTEFRPRKCGLEWCVSPLSQEEILSLNKLSPG